MNNKYFLWIAVGIIVLIIIVGVARRSDDRSYTTPGSPSASPTATAPSGAATTSRPPAGSTGGVSLSYQDALKRYAGVRIQFDARCQAIPNQLVIKKGTSIMLDNRSGDPRTVSVGTVRYSLAGYGFRIVTPTSATLPATLLIDCGSAQNVGQILIQK